MAANYRSMARKLQMALAAQGRRIAINQYQAYSAKAGRTVTKYVLSEYKQPTGAPRGKYENFFATWSMPEVVRALAAIYAGEDLPSAGPANTSERR